MKPSQRLALSSESPSLPHEPAPAAAPGKQTVYGWTGMLPKAFGDPGDPGEWGGYSASGVTSHACARCGAALALSTSASSGFHVPGTREGAPSICAACHDAVSK
jgi:hypothetical protein